MTRDQSKGTTLEDARRWLRERNRYLLDQGSFRPRWGVPGEVPRAQDAWERSLPGLMRRQAW